jgi:hypothetical protein
MYIKKDYSAPVSSFIPLFIHCDLCTVSGNDGGGSGTGEEEEDLSKGRINKDNTWGDLW